LEEWGRGTERARKERWNFCGGELIGFRGMTPPKITNRSYGASPLGACRRIIAYVISKTLYR